MKQLNLWSEEETALFESGMTDAEIARKTGRSELAVSLKRRRIDYDENTVVRNKPWNTTELKYFVRNYGLIPTTEIAYNLGRSVGALYERATSMRLTRTWRKHHGNKHRDAR